MDTLPLAMGSQSEVPVIKPNWNEFKDFKSFIAVVEQQGVHRMGMAKVIPPPEWIVRSDGYDNLNVVIPMPISQKIAGIQGIYQQTITKLQSLTIREFELLANSDKYRTPHYRDFDDLEEMFWKSLLTSQPIYGADVPHSLFDQEQDVWNFQYLDTILDTLAETEDSYDIKGITSPYLYYGMWRSSFAWHTEDMDLYSVNYLHYGAARTWYVIPPEHGKKFEKLAGALFPNVAQNCDAFLRHKTILISPEILQQYSIPVYKVIQEPGEIMISFPYSYRAGFNHGFNCAEAINFATKRWIEYGKRALLCDCSKSLVRFKMDIFVRKYQPENYQRWVTANDRDKHPEAPDENILHPQLLRQMNLHMGVDPNMTNSIKVEGGHISGLGGLGGDELHAAAAAAAAAAVGVGPGSSGGAGGSGTGPLSPTNMTPTTALAAAAVAAASGSTSGTVQTAGALASPSTSGTKGELGNTDVVKVFKQVHTKVIPASVDLYREAQAKGLVGNEPLTRKRSLEAPQQEESYKQLRALEEGADTDGPFKCTTCGVEFLESNQLKNHLRSHSRDKPYWCGYCGKVFSQEQSLKVHLRIHTGEKPYKCDICERQFTQMSSLNRHFRVHTGERPYRCETCGKDFAQPGTLRDHAMTHTGHKPFKCGTCGKGFIQSTAMKTHERTHTGERPYKCGTCGKGFRQSSLLNIHEKTHLAEKPYGCDICSRSFTTKSFLQIHKKTHNQHNLGDLVQKGALGSASNLPPPTAIKQERSTSEADALNVAASALNELQHHVSVSSQRGAAGMGAAAHAAGSNRDLGGDLQIVTRGEALDLHRDLQAHRGNAGGGGGDASTSDHGVLSPTKLPPASSFKHSTLQQVQAMQQQQDMDQTLLTADQVIDQALLARTQEQAALDRVMDRSLYDRTALERTAALALQRVVQPQNLSATSRTLSQDLSQASMTSTGAPDDSHTSPQGGVGVDGTAQGVNTSLHEASPLHDRVTVAAGAGAGAPYGLADQANELLHQQHNANQQLQEEEPTAYLAAPSSHAHSVAHTGGLSHSAVVAHSGGVTHTGVSMSDAQLLLDQQTSPHSLVTRNTGGASSVTTSQPGLLNETLSLSQGMHDKTALQYAIAALRDYPEVFQERTTTPGGTSTATIVAANTTGVLQGETLSPTSQSRQEEQHRQLVTSIIRGDNTALHFVTAALRNASGENHGGQHDVGTDLSITATTGAAAGSSAGTGGAGNPPQGLPQSEAELKKAALAQAVSALYPQATGQAQQERDLLLPENLTQHQQQHQQLLSINSQMSPNHTGLNPTNPASTPPHDTGREGQEIGSTQVHNAAMAAVSALQMSQQLEQVSALNQAAAMHTSSIQQTILQQAMSLQQAALQEAATIPARSSASPTSQPQ